MAKVNPLAIPIPRSGDENLSLEQIRAMKLFEERDKPLEKEPLVNYPGALILRRFKQGETIITQGESGWTLFYVLTTTDRRELRESQHKPDAGRDLVTIISELKTREEQIEQLKASIKAKREQLTQLLNRQDTPQSDVNRGRQELEANEEQLRDLVVVAEVTLAVDGKKHGTAVSMDTPPDFIYEGELFGEMSCLYRTPRSATVVATRECYVLEILRNVYERWGHTKEFKKRMDEVQWERIVRLHLRNHELFRSLSQDDFDRLQPDIRAQAQMISVKAGDIICDEFERADALYIIRSGYVKVAKNVSALLPVDLIENWRPLCIAFANDPIDAAPAGARQQLQKSFSQCSAFSAVSDLAASNDEDATLTVEERSEVIHAINDTIRAPKGLWWSLCSLLAKGAPPKKKAKSDTEDPPDVRDPAVKAIWEQATVDHPKALQDAANPKSGIAFQLIQTIQKAIHQEVKWRGQEAIRKACDLCAELVVDEAVFAGLNPMQRLRYLNRAVLCAMFPEELPPISFASPPRTIVYRRRGEFIGEIGVIGAATEGGDIEMIPRTATCLAYDHPIGGNQPGDVQLVRLGAELFHKIWHKSADLRESLSKTIRERMADASPRDVVATGASSTVPPEIIDDLGLVQGNRLMLIDLDRCTRCNECVDACVQTHRLADAENPLAYQASRLYLDGPRAGRYLVPATCRQCVDPVCLIGCPVGSIHKGDLGQTVIEDWCIGCTICARNCPYDAIQMHHLGLLQRRSGIWHYHPSPGNEDWFRGQDTSQWQLGSSPIYFDAEFRRSLREAFGSVRSSENRIHFLAKFEIGSSELKGGDYLLQIESVGSDVQAWLNGNTVELTFKRVRERDVVWHYQATVSGTANGQSTSSIKVGTNVMAISLVPPSDPAEVMLDLGIYALNKPDATSAFLGDNFEWDEKFIMQRAIVCDMCASIPSKTPSCVAACPHDAAWRGTVDEAPFRTA